MSFGDYKQYSTAQIRTIFDLKIEIDQDLFPTFIESDRTDERLQTAMEKMESRINFSTVDDEVTRSSLLVSHILREASDTYNLGIFFEPSVGIKPDSTPNLPYALNGNYDCALSLDQLDFSTPIISVIEVKKSSLSDGLGQCVADMYATLKQFKKDKVYCIITDGEVWSFLLLQSQ